ncbi:MAG TPA: c-type cytochrome [Solirubrobacterales bacterium]
MSNGDLFYACGIALAASAVVLSFIGLRSEKFPGRAFPLVVLWFAILVGCSTTFAVLHAKDEEKHEEPALQKANEQAVQEEGQQQPVESGQAEAPAPVIGPGEELFTGACASCHTLAAAGATGTVGPDLDTLQPDAQTVEVAIRIGGTGAGVMPPGLYSGKQAEEVAAYVAAVAGQG